MSLNLISSCPVGSSEEQHEPSCNQGIIKHEMERQVRFVLLQLHLHPQVSVFVEDEMI